VEADQSSSSAPSGGSEGVGGWFLKTALQLRVNPLGLTLVTDAGYRVPLSDSQSLLLDGTHLDVGLTTQVSPAYAWAGPRIEVVPLAVLVLFASAQRLYYFGTFGYLYELGGLDADWSPERLSQIEDDGLGQTAWGSLVEVGGTLQALLAGVAAQVTTVYRWVWMDVETAYVEPWHDLLLAPHDATWTVTALLGYLLLDDYHGLLLGGLAEHTLTREGGTKRDVAGLLVLWVVPADWWRWGSAEVAGLVGLYARDPYRKGEPFFGAELSVAF
jgi:hypothetical protein